MAFGQGTDDRKDLRFTGFVLAASLALTFAAHAEDFKLGVAGPITGPNAAFGAQLQQGTQHAVDDLNAKGGMLYELIPKTPEVRLRPLMQRFAEVMQRSGAIQRLVEVS